MSTSTTANAKPLFAGLLALLLLLAILFVMKLVDLLVTIAVVALVVVGLYEAFRFVTTMRGGVAPPSSLGLIRGTGRVALVVARGVPGVARWAGRTAYVAAHATQEVATGAVFGGLVGFGAGWHYDWPLFGAVLGLTGGTALGLLVGRRRLRAAGMLPPVTPAAQSQGRGS
jgi:hypothetical protein